MIKLKKQKAGFTACSCILCFSLFAPPAFGSLFVSPHGSGRDAELAGNTVASPDDGSSAQQFNPAGVAGPARDQGMAALLAFQYVTHYKNDATGYDGTGNKTPINLSLWYGLGEIEGWSLGVGAYGALGTAYDMPADPDIGLTSPYIGELAILNFGVSIGREVIPGLRIGAQLTPAYGRQRVRTPSPLGDVDIKAEGLGLSSMVGLVYSPTSQWSLGLSYRSRGFIDMKGDGSVGGNEQDISVDFVTPQMLMGGLAYKWSERLNLMGQLSWMRHKDFEKGDVKFDETPLLDQPVMMHTRNRVRWGVGLEYVTVPNSVFRIGYTESKAAMNDAGVMPIMFDNDNKMVMAGYEIDYGRLMLGYNVGWTKLKTRRISEESSMFPGRYAADGDMSAGIHLTWQLRNR